MANQTITLYVNTSVNLTPQNVDTYCNFGQSSGTNEDFTTDVNVGDTVTWEGSATAGSGTVNIEKVQYEGGSDVFGTSVLDGTGSPKTVNGTVANDTGGDEETYTILFSVSNQNGTFRIDPKIQVNPE